MCACAYIHVCSMYAVCIDTCMLYACVHTYAVLNISTGMLQANPSSTCMPVYACMYVCMLVYTHIHMHSNSATHQLDTHNTRASGHPSILKAALPYSISNLWSLCIISLQNFQLRLCNVTICCSNVTLKLLFVQIEVSFRNGVRRWPVIGFSE